MPKGKKTKQPDFVQKILDAAYNHGNASEGDHEIGDLQDALRIAFSKLTPEQAQGVHDEYFEDHETWAEYADDNDVGTDEEE